MPELAEVFWFSRRWAPAVGATVTAVAAPVSRVFRHETPESVVAALTGRRLLGCASRGKRAAFRFSDGVWLGIHLGMTGRLFPESERAAVFPFASEGGSPRAPAAKHDRLRLVMSDGAVLVYHDPRMFGEVRVSVGEGEPAWWAQAGRDPADAAWSEAAVAAHRVWRGRAPVKAVLLRQDLFPGVGNWMADEILYVARVRPGRPACALTPEERAAVCAAVRRVCREALASVGAGAEPPANWLFHRRWRDGGRCPRTGAPLVRETVGGRTSCWSPAWQL